MEAREISKDNISLNKSLETEWGYELQTEASACKSPLEQALKLGLSEVPQTEIKQIWTHGWGSN